MTNTKLTKDPALTAATHSPTPSPSPSPARHATISARAPYLAWHVRCDAARSPIPLLHLQGRWLARAGCAIGATVRVRVAPGRLVIETTEHPHCARGPSLDMSIADSAQADPSNTG